MICQYLLGFFICLLSTIAAAAPMSLSLPHINTALGCNLSNSNSVTQVDIQTDWTGGSEDFGWTLGRANNALATAEASTNAVARLDTLETAFAAVDLDYCGFPSMLVYSASEASLTLDLSEQVGDNVAVVILRFQRGNFYAPSSITCWAYPFGTSLPADSTGCCLLPVGDDSGSAACFTDNHGKVSIHIYNGNAVNSLKIYIEAYVAKKAIN